MQPCIKKRKFVVGQEILGKVLQMGFKMSLSFFLLNVETRPFVC
jgi:hypothetical protein